MLSIMSLISKSMNLGVILGILEPQHRELSLHHYLL